MKILVIAAAILTSIMAGIGGMIHFREHERREIVAARQQEQEIEASIRQKNVDDFIKNSDLEYRENLLGIERGDIPRLESRLRQATSPGEAALATERLRDAKERIKKLESTLEDLRK